MDYLSTKETAEKWNISTARIVKLASSGRINGAILVGKSWLIPKDAVKPADGRFKKQEIITLHKFHFPLYTFSNLSLQQAQIELSPAELNLYKAQLLVEEGNITIADDLLARVITGSDDIYTKIGALYYKSECSLILENFDNYIHEINQIRKLYQIDFPYKKEMEFILLDIDGQVYGDKIYTEQFSINTEYDYNEEVIPYMTVLSAYSSLIKSYTSHSKTTPEAFEPVCLMIENQKNFRTAISLHTYIALMYLINNNNNKKLQHLNRAFELSEKNKCISNLVIFYPYISKELKEYISIHDCKNLQTIPEKSETYKKSLGKLLKIYKKNFFYTKFDYEDYKYIRYARLGLTNKEISIIENKSESFVNKRYLSLYEKTGASSKADLYKAYSNNINNYE